MQRHGIDALLLDSFSFFPSPSILWTELLSRRSLSALCPRYYSTWYVTVKFCPMSEHFFGRVFQPQLELSCLGHHEGSSIINDNPKSKIMLSLLPLALCALLSFAIVDWVVYKRRF